MKQYHATRSCWFLSKSEKILLFLSANDMKLMLSLVNIQCLIGCQCSQIPSSYKMEVWTFLCAKCQWIIAPTLISFVLLHLVQVHAEILHNEMESIEEGIVELISQNGIRKLAMGAAADKQHTKQIQYFFFVDQDLPYMIFYARLLHHELFFFFPSLRCF